MPAGPGTGPRADGGPATTKGARAMLMPPFPGTDAAVARRGRLARAAGSPRRALRPAHA